MDLAPSKRSVIEALVAQLEKERVVYDRIAAQARLDAIDGEMKQEGKYDTRAIEASYLAGAQKRRLEEIIVEIQTLKALPIVNLERSRSVTVGSLVELQIDGLAKWFFVSPTSGGVDVNTSPSVKVVSLKSPIGQALLGLESGDEPSRVPLPQPLKNACVVNIL
jgi:transcription elongation GreA/GreB family factor